MKTLQISRTGKIELARGFLNQPSILIGRSPVCDIVVRDAAIKPIHYLLEWIGEGEFSEHQKSDWALIDISLEATETQNQKSGMGVMLSEKETTLNGLQFIIKEEALSETYLQNKALKKSIDSESTLQRSKKSEVKLDPVHSIIEIIQLRRNSQSVENVYHVNSSLNVKSHQKPHKESKAQYFSQIFKTSFDFLDFFNIDWASKAGSPPQIKMNSSRELKIWNKGESIQGNEGVLSLNAFDFYSIETEVYEFYIRVVKKINTSKLRPKIWEDPLYRNALFIFLLFLFLYFMAFDYFSMIEDKTPPPPKRIARVEVKEEKKLEVPPPPPPPPPQIETAPVQKVPPPPPVPPKEVVQKKELPASPQKNQSSSQPAQKSAAAPSVKNSHSTKPEPGFNADVQKSKENAIGLPSFLKSKSKGENIRPEDVKQLIQNETANSSKPTVLIPQGPSGKMQDTPFKTKNPGAGGNENLNAAQTTLQSNGAGKDQSLAPLAKTGGSGTGLGNLSGLSGNGAGGFKDIDSLEKGFDVDGGLTKETVRRVVDASKKSIGICYSQSLQTNPRLAGKVVFNWHISGKTGAVSTVSKKESTIKGAPVFDACLQRVISEMSFPPAPNARNTIVNYPFLFQPTGKK